MIGASSVGVTDAAPQRGRPTLRAVLGHRVLALALGVLSVLSLTGGIWRWSAHADDSATWTTSGVVVREDGRRHELDYDSAARQARSGLLPSERQAAVMDEQAAVGKRTLVLLIVAAFLCLLSLGTGRLDRIASPIFAVLAAVIVTYAVSAFGGAAQDSARALQLYENAESSGRTPASLLATLFAIAIPVRLLAPAILARARGAARALGQARQARFENAVERAVHSRSATAVPAATDLPGPSPVRTMVTQVAAVVSSAPSAVVEPAQRLRPRTSTKKLWLGIAGALTAALLAGLAIHLRSRPAPPRSPAEMTESELRTALADASAKNALDVVRVLGMPFTTGLGGGLQAFYVYNVTNGQTQVWFQHDLQAPASVKFKSRADLTRPEQMQYLLYDPDD